MEKAFSSDLNQSIIVILNQMATATKKKSAQEYPDSQNYKQTVKKQINVNNDEDIDGPYNLNDRFKNL